MNSHDAITEINSAMDRLRAVRDDLGQQLAERTCQSSETKRMSDLHGRVALAIAAYKRGK
ncbi:hypothetical protein [Aliiroseovarius marinus]|uniref:hypothetical protein n=1 Tax=Aliiroseovarius marinus TaxID=2500159 RepID=UPI00249418E5|nr:hypothetical protein [Aliiroseovarius marinus]